MSSRIDPQARTTPKIRQEMKESGFSDREAAKVFNINCASAAKSLKPDDFQDRSHRTHTLHITLSAEQEALVPSLRPTLYFPFDDLRYIIREYITADVSRVSLARLLKRDGTSRLADMFLQSEGQTLSPTKTFKDYESAFGRVDIKWTSA